MNDTVLLSIDTGWCVSRRLNPHFVLIALETKTMAVVVERTLALIKPDAVHRTDDILDLAQSAGFVVLQVTLPTLRC